MKRVQDPLNPDEGLLMVTKEEWDELIASRRVVEAARVHDHGWINSGQPVTVILDAHEPRCPLCVALAALTEGRT